MSSKGQTVATVESARVRVALFSLLAGNVRPLELHLQRPVFSIERISPGVFNVYSSETDALNDLSLRRLRALVDLTRTVWHPACTFDTAIGAICVSAAGALQV